MPLADTNAVDLYLSEETTWGETPSAPTMDQVRFTGEGLKWGKQSATSNQIRSDQMRDSVGLVGYNTEGNVNIELAFAGFDKLWTGLFGSDFQTAAVTGLALNVVEVDKTITRGSGSFILDGVKPGMWVKTDGFASAGNNGIFKVAAVSALVITLDTNTTGLADETGGGGETVAGKMLRNGTSKKSFLLEKRFTDVGKCLQFLGMRVSGANLQITAKEVITGRFDFLGKTQMVSASTVAGTSNSASSSDIMTASANVAKILMDGQPLGAPVKSLSWDMKRNLREQSQVGSTAAGGIGYGYIDVTGQLEVYFQDLVLYSMLQNHTTTGLSWVMTDTDGNTAVITLPKVYFTDGSPSAGGGNADVMLPLQYTAVRDPNTDCLVQLDLLAA